MTIDEAIKYAEEVASKECEDWIHCIKCREEHKQLAKLLKELKQLREQTQWIPISERLPKTDGRFLTYIENPYNSQLSYIMVCDYINKDWCPDDDTASDNVVAWMPLLEPYKE